MFFVVGIESECFSIECHEKKTLVLAMTNQNYCEITGCQWERKLKEGNGFKGGKTPVTKSELVLHLIGL